MKRGFFILALALLAGLAGFALTSRHPAALGEGNDGAVSRSSSLPELQWLHEEFGLTNEQFEKVSELHLAYLPTCKLLCEKIIVSRKKMAALVLEGRTLSPELAAALREHSLLLEECQTAMLGHIYETAASLSPEQAERYLETMMPYVITMTADHTAE